MCVVAATVLLCLLQRQSKHRRTRERTEAPYRTFGSLGIHTPCMGSGRTHSRAPTNATTSMSPSMATAASVNSAKPIPWPP
jgi:hypothetical protein